MTITLGVNAALMTALYRHTKFRHTLQAGSAPSAGQTKENNGKSTDENNKDSSTKKKKSESSYMSGKSERQLAVTILVSNIDMLKVWDII